MLRKAKEKKAKEGIKNKANCFKDFDIMIIFINSIL